MRDAQKDVAAIATVRDEFLKNKPPSIPHRKNLNLIDEAPLFCDDVEFDSENYTLTAHFDTPHKLVFTKIKSELTVSISLPKGATLENPEHVENALSKLYRRVKYYTNY
jgi:hypothetical protein